MTIEARAFRCIRSHGPITPREVVKRIGHTMWGVRKAIYRLRDKGYVQRVDGARFIAIKQRSPQDGRGSAPASRENLALALPGEGAYAKARKMAEARGEIYVFRPTPKPATALEQAWGFLPVSVVDASNETCEDLRGEVRPEKTKAA